MTTSEALQNMAHRYEAMQRMIELCRNHPEWQQQEPELADILKALER